MQFTPFSSGGGRIDAETDEKLKQGGDKMSKKTPQKGRTGKANLQKENKQHNVKKEALGPNTNQ